MREYGLHVQFVVHLTTPLAQSPFTTLQLHSVTSRLFGSPDVSPSDSSLLPSSCVVRTQARALSVKGDNDLVPEACGEDEIRCCMGRAEGST